MPGALDGDCIFPRVDTAYLWTSSAGNHVLPLHQGVSKCGSWTLSNSISNHLGMWETYKFSDLSRPIGPITLAITLECERNANSQTFSRSPESEILGLSSNNLCFKKPSRWFWYRSKFENHCPILWSFQPSLIYKILGQDPLFLMECQDKHLYKV